MRFSERLMHGWNAFTSQNSVEERFDYGMPAAYGVRPDRSRLTFFNDRSIISSIYTRLSIDVAAVDIRHVRLDNNSRYIGDMDSGLNECLTLEANIDQAARAFRQDIAMTLFDKGVCAIVPVDTDLNPKITGGYDIKTLRVGDIVTWYPEKVKVSLYNEKVGERQEVILPKKMVAIVENPLYSIMNEPNSTLQRLIRKLALMDSIDEQVGSGKLDLIIQLPYVIKSEARKQQADARRKDIEFQLAGSKYGIAYTDGTEKITQLNRPAENNMLKQVEYLFNTLYGQLGLTPEILNGTADEKTMLNYNNRTIKPVLDAITEAMTRTFLTKTARSQKQSIMYFKDPFSLVPVNDIAEIADKFTRNEILTANEIRSIIGFKPSEEAKADQLMNSNMPQSDLMDPEISDEEAVDSEVEDTSQDSDIMNSAFDELESAIQSILDEFGDSGDGTEA